MSALGATATATATGMPSGELAAVQRVQELQLLIEKARQGAVSSPVAAGVSSVASSVGSASPTGFAAALQAASSTGQPQGGEGTAATSSEYDPLITQAAARYGLDPAVLHGLIQQESGFDPSSTSSAGAAGLTQLMPGTASSMGVANALNPSESIEGGARYLSQLMSEFSGNTEEALAAYNAGPGAVQKYGGIPPYPETQSYVSKVLGYAEAYRQAQPASVTAGALT